METQIQVVFWKNAERMKSVALIRQLVGHHVRSAQVGQDFREQGECANLKREASSSSCFGQLMQQEAFVGAGGWRLEVYSVQNGTRANDGVQSFARRRYAHVVVAIGKENEDLTGIRVVPVRGKPRCERQSVEKGSRTGRFEILKTLLADTAQTV